MLTDPSSPPLELCDGMPARISTWLCEDRQWPVIHSILPFILYLYIRDVKFALLLAYVFESLEALAQVFLQSVLLDSNGEIIGDMLISDILMALLGVTIGVVWVRIMGYKYQHLTPFYKGSEVTWVLYAIEFVSLTIPTYLLYSFPTSINGFVSIVYLMAIVWIPGFYLLFSMLNEGARHWFTRLDGNSGTYKIFYSPVDKVNFPLYRRFHRITALCMFIYLCTFIYRYTSVFVMACIHNGVILFILSVYGLASGRLVDENK